MKLAIIETGGKQYLVSEGQKIQVERLGVGSGKWEFDKVLLVAEVTPSNPPYSKGDVKLEVGKPYIMGKKVTAELLGEKRLPKVTTFKYHSKTRYRKKKGHRQTVTLARIIQI